MPVKLLFALILVVLVACFTGFNLNNKCDLWLFYTFKDLPIFATVIASFACGVLVTLPFTFGKKRKSEDNLLKEKRVKGWRRKSSNKNKQDESEEEKTSVVDFDNV